MSGIFAHVGWQINTESTYEPTSGMRIRGLSGPDTWITQPKCNRFGPLKTLAPHSAGESCDHVSWLGAAFYPITTCDLGQAGL